MLHCKNQRVQHSDVEVSKNLEKKKCESDLRSLLHETKLLLAFETTTAQLMGRSRTFSAQMRSSFDLFFAAENSSSPTHVHVHVHVVEVGRALTE